MVSKINEILKKIGLASIFGIIVSIFVIVYIIYNINFSLVGLAFKKLDTGWIFLMIIIYLFGFILRGVRWHLMLLPIKYIRYKSTIEGVVVGHMANSVLPARAGELVRAIFIGNIEKISKASALGTVFIERVFDGLVIVGILIISLLVLKFDVANRELINSIAVMGSLIFFSAIVVLFIGAKYRKLLEKPLIFVINYLPGKMSDNGERVASNFLDSLNVLKALNKLPYIITCSICIWLAEGSIFWIAFIAFHLPGNLLMAYFTLAFVNLGMIIPSAPGGIGLFQGANILAFSFFAISMESALSYSIVIHSIMIIPTVLIGLFIINRHGIILLKTRLFRSEVN